MSEKLYEQRNAYELDVAGSFYIRHVSAMTSEGLHSKADIAAELGYRDSVISKLKADYDKLAAECALLNKFISESCYAYDGDGCDVCDSYVNAEESIWFPKTPATNAAIAEWKARGVEEFVSELSVKLRLAGGEDGRSLVYYGEYADHMESKGEDFAAKLRAGVEP